MLFAVAVVLGQTGMGGAAPWYGVWGTYFGGSSQPYSLRVLTIDPGGPVDRVGLRSGDLIDLRDQTLGQRFELLGQPLNGQALRLSVSRGSTRTLAVVMPTRLDFTRFWNYLLMDFGSFWLLLFATVIAWRRPYVHGNLLLATVLAFVAIGTIALPAAFAAPWSWTSIVLGIVGQVLPLSMALWAAFASSFARPLSLPRRISLGLCYAFVAVDMIVGTGTPDLTIGLAPLIATITLWFDPVFFLGPLWTILTYAIMAMALVCSGLAVAASRGVDRSRALWSLVPLAGLYCALQWSGSGFQFMSYAWELVAAYIFGIALVVTPLVLTYVALNRRLIDVGFALNRTVVFAAVSAIVIAAFVLVEWAASEWFAGLNHRASAVIGMIVALALGMSLRYIHKYVDRFVDRVFFRKRHDDEAALRNFAHEAAFINDRDILLQRAVATVKQHTDATDAVILVRDGTAIYALAGQDECEDVSENDAAIVALRAWGKPVDLHTIDDTQVRGEWAFPMISRGDLLGLLVCGPKRDGEAYAPDEADALRALAHGVGTALDTLMTRNDRALDSLRQTQTLILERLDMLAIRANGGGAAT
jgi:GAF domain-containing protein